MKNLFNKTEKDAMITRINKLTPDTKPGWGKMTVNQMLAHCNVAYEFVYTDKHPRPNAFLRFVLQMTVKKAVVGPKPYPKNGRTAPAFIIKDERDFETEKKRLIDYLNKTCELGADHFDGKENLSFGKMSVNEWNMLFSKHLDHHLTQFGV